MAQKSAQSGKWIGNTAPATGVAATPPTPVTSPQPQIRRDDMLAKRRRWYYRLFRWTRGLFMRVLIGSIWLFNELAWKRPWLGVIIITIITLCALSNDFLNLTLMALELLGQLAFAIFFAIIQFVAIFWFMARSKTEVILPGDPKSLTLADYKGQKQLVKLVKEWISLLSDRRDFQRMGGNYINGLLLYGPPGTGKTMLAKCMAGEAGIAFMSIEGSGFRAMFWGVDVLKMIQFCGKAKSLAQEYGACIAYIDEIDAVGASRGGVMGGGMGMGMGGMMGGGSGSLTRLLYEMDGIGELTMEEKINAWAYRFIGKKPPIRDWHVLYMGSTNRPDVLDPALTRPGRFDRSIEVNVPDKTGRREIITYYLSKIAHDETVDIEAIIADTNGATPARIMSAITKDAVRIALFAGKTKVGQRDIDLAFQEQYFGIENPIEEMEEDQRKVLAYHEAGHAIVQHYVMPDQRIVRVSIIRRGGAYGYVLPVDTKEWHIIPLRRYIADIMVSFAGRGAEKVFFGEPFNSVGGDFANIRRNLMLLISTGMFGPPPLNDGGMMGGGPNHPEAQRYWEMLEKQVEDLLRIHANEVHAVANALLERSDLNSAEVVALIEQARKEAIARGEDVPDTMPEMLAQLLPHHEAMARVHTRRALKAPAPQVIELTSGEVARHKKQNKKRTTRK